MPARTDDAPLETLLLPVLAGRVTWPEDGALFLRAREGWPLHERELPGLVCEQTFKPDADALLRAGLNVRAGGPGSYSLVLVLPPRQRDEARSLIARATTLVKPGGRIIACMSNDEGARSSENDFAKLLGPIEGMVKNKCRVFWSAPLDRAPNSALLNEWLQLDAIRPIGDGRFLSRPGLFAWDRIDAASMLLAANLPTNLGGRAADLGAGFGYLSAELLRRCSGISALHLYEAEHRALDLARQNLNAASQIPIEFRWHDVTAGLPERYDVIVTNPPFHTGSRTERPDVGKRFITVAADALNPGGRLWLVANRHLPYETVLGASFGTVRTVTQQQGFKVIEAVKARSARQ